MSQRLMRECPKYPSCSAPLCPLDADWKLRVGNRSEPVCFYLNEYGKEGAVERFSTSSITDIHAACTRMLSDPLLPAWMSARVTAAAATGSRWDAGQRLHAAWLANKAEAL